MCRARVPKLAAQRQRAPWQVQPRLKQKIVFSSRFGAYGSGSHSQDDFQTAVGISRNFRFGPLARAPHRMLLLPLKQGIRVLRLTRRGGTARLSGELET